MAGGIGTYCFVRACVRVRPDTLLTRYLVEYLTHFRHTYINDAVLPQGRGDGPKAGTSGVIEAARAKTGARTGVCFA